MAESRVVFSTAGSREEASKIAKALVEERLAACVNIIGPIQSVYRWEGKVDKAEEFLMVVKTTSVRSAEVISRIRELHSYDLPEAIEISITGGSPQYLTWIAECVR